MTVVHWLSQCFMVQSTMNNDSGALAESMFYGAVNNGALTKSVFYDGVNIILATKSNCLKI